MKKLAVVVVMTGMLGGSLAMDALAQTRPAARADRPATTSSTFKRETWGNTHGFHDSRDLIGTRVKNAQGKDIGGIDALIIDPEDGKVTHAVVGVGGFLGIGEKHVIVPWSDVKVAMDHRNMVLTIDQPALERAPRYERKTLMSDRDRTPAASPATTDSYKTNNPQPSQRRP